MEQNRPKVGIGVIIERDGKILIGERLSDHGANTFQIPGGHLEFGESFEEAAIREAIEETGLKKFKARGVISVGNDIGFEKHYVSIGVHLECFEGEPTDPEPDHSRNWHWADPRNLPEPFFPHSKRVIANWLSGNIYENNNLS